MLEDVDQSFKNLNGRQKRKAKRMLNRAMDKKDDNRAQHEIDQIIKYIKKCGA